MLTLLDPQSVIIALQFAPLHHNDCMNHKTTKDITDITMYTKGHSTHPSSQWTMLIVLTLRVVRAANTIDLIRVRNWFNTQYERDFLNCTII